MITTKPLKEDSADEAHGSQGYLDVSDAERVAGFVLKYTDVRKLITKVSLPKFVSVLVDEVDSAYRNLELHSKIRVGWPTPLLDTLEMMGCETPDSSTIKVIGSAPSAVRGLAQVVEGTLTSNKITNDKRVQLHSDATVLTPLRTAASTAAVLRRIKPSFEAIGVVGAGLEGTSHAYILALLFNDVQTILLTDVDIQRAKRAANRLRLLLLDAGIDSSRDIEITYADMSQIDDIYASDVIVTATYGVATGRGVSPVITNKDRLKAGTFIAAVGADLERKRELSDDVYAMARFIADDLAQCFKDGELQHAAKTFGIDRDEIANLEGHGGVLLDGRIMGVVDFLGHEPQFLDRPEPIIIYDSTGFSGQDHAVAEVVRRFLEELSWPKDLWNPPGDLDFYELVTEPELRTTDIA